MRSSQESPLIIASQDGNSGARPHHVPGRAELAEDIARVVLGFTKRVE